jgi:RND family efflux transporter MFP subunit
VQTPSGSFRVRLRQIPADPRTGEEAQFEAEILEQVEGGFGAGGNLQPVENAFVAARVTDANGAAVAAKLETHKENRPGVYGVHHAFTDAGNFKLFFDARTEDGRAFSVDFPVAVQSAPVNLTFWLGLVRARRSLCGRDHRLVLLAQTRQRKRTRSRAPDSARGPCRRVVLCHRRVRAHALLPAARTPRKRSDAGGNRSRVGGTTPANGDPALGGAGALINISKESQLLFSIRTEPVVVREIVSGLKTTGVVRARPEARGVVTPPVSGRVSLNGNITNGAAVGRGQRIGTIEQVLGAPEQAELESRRIELRTAALEQQARQSEQQALAQQARTRLMQARRELQRATNLLEAGAASQRRVEEAQTAVRLAEQEAASAEGQARIAGQQATLAKTSAAGVEPVRAFPLIAPVTGIIASLNVTTGQQVESGRELMSIINLSSVLLEAQVFEKDLAAARESGRATYTAPSLGGEVYRIGEGGEGRLVSIGQSIDPQTRTVPVTFEVPNPLNRLREGMFVELTLDTSGRAQVLSVPKASVITEQGRTFVFVFRGGETYERRIVVLGSEGQDYYEVRSGVQANERVVTEGIYQLRSTQPGT